MARSMWAPQLFVEVGVQSFRPAKECYAAANRIRIRSINRSYSVLKALHWID